jgi:hypothetical protein
MFEYAEWKGVVPIECAVNAALLLAGERRVVQIDITYYESSVTQRIERMIDALRDTCVIRYDASGNVILYLARNAPRIESLLRQKDGTVEGGFRSVAFSRLLDAQFYCCTDSLSSVFTHDHLVRASIDVVDERGRSGALLVQMLYPTMARKCVGTMYARFEHLTRRIRALDPSLHTALTMYTKPGNWKEGPEFAAQQLTALP